MGFEVKSSEGPALRARLFLGVPARACSPCSSRARRRRAPASPRERVLRGEADVLTWGSRLCNILWKARLWKRRKVSIPYKYAVARWSGI